jgi:hypothetical protein
VASQLLSARSLEPATLIASDNTERSLCRQRLLQAVLGRHSGASPLFVPFYSKAAEFRDKLSDY